MEFETLRESSILAGTDAVEHSSIAKSFVFIVSIIVTAYALVQHFMSYVDGYVENVVISAFDDCDILDKAIYTTGNVNNYSMVTIKARKDMRSRNAKYVYYNYCRVRLCKQRDPS